MSRKLIKNLLSNMFRGESSLMWGLFLFCVAVFFGTAFFVFLVQGIDKYQKGGPAWEAALSGLCLLGLIILIWKAGKKALAAWGRDRKRGKLRKLYLLGIILVLGAGAGFVAFLPPHMLLVNQPSDFVVNIAGLFAPAAMAAGGGKVSSLLFCLGCILLSNFAPGPHSIHSRSKKRKMAHMGRQGGKHK